MTDREFENLSAKQTKDIEQFFRRNGLFLTKAKGKQVRKMRAKRSRG